MKVRTSACPSSASSHPGTCGSSSRISASDRRCSRPRRGTQWACARGIRSGMAHSWHCSTETRSTGVRKPRRRTDRIPPMIQISENAQSHFRKLLEREALPGLGVRLAAVHPGTARADVQLEFAEPADLNGDEWAIDCEGFTLWLDASSVKFLDVAEIDFTTQATGGQLQIRAPNIKGKAPDASASLVERVRWLV